MVITNFLNFTNGRIRKMANRKEGKLSLCWSKRHNDFMVNFPRKPDGGLVMSHLIGNYERFDLTKWLDGTKPPSDTENFIKELERRGYDPKTIKFSIELKKGGVKG